MWLSVNKLFNHKKEMLEIGEMMISGEMLL